MVQNQYHFGNKCVFRLDSKVATLLEVRSDLGNLFQSWHNIAKSVSVGFIEISRIQSIQDDNKVFLYEKGKMANVMFEILDSFSLV